MTLPGERIEAQCRLASVAEAAGGGAEQVSSVPAQAAPGGVGARSETVERRGGPGPVRPLRRRRRGEVPAPAVVLPVGNRVLVGCGDGGGQRLHQEPGEPASAGSRWNVSTQRTAPAAWSWRHRLTLTNPRSNRDVTCSTLPRSSTARNRAGWSADPAAACVVAHPMGDESHGTPPASMVASGGGVELEAHGGEVGASADGQRDRRRQPVACTSATGSGRDASWRHRAR